MLGQAICGWGCEDVGADEAQAPRVQETENQFQGPKAPSTLLADGEEPTDFAPADGEPEEVELALETALAEVGHAAVADRVDPGRAEGGDGELPLNFGVSRPEHRKFLKRRRTHPVRLEVVEHRLRAGHLVQVDELEGNRDHARALDREVPRVDVGVLPVVVTGLHHLLDGHPIVDGDDVLVGLAVDRQGVQEELLQVLPGNPTRLRLGDQFAQLNHGNLTHRTFSLASAVKQLYIRHHCRTYHCQ